MFRRRVQDSQGNWGEIILFSELANPNSTGEDGEELSVEEIAEKFISHIPNLGFGETSSINDDEKQRYIDLLKLAFTMLTPKQQMVVYLYFYKNKNYSDIAKIVGVSPSAIRQDMKVAIKNLREVMLGKKGNLQKSPNSKRGKKQKKGGIDLFSVLL